MRKEQRKKFLAQFLALAMVVQTCGTTAPVNVKAASTDVIFHDFEGNSVPCTTGGSLATDEKKNGDKSLKLEYESNNSNKDITIESKNGTLDVSNQEYLTFWILDSKANTIRVKLVDENGNKAEKWTSKKSVPGKWTFIEMPLSDFQGADLEAISKIAIYEYNAGTYYIDDIEFVQELPASDDTPMTGKATLFQNFETDNTEAAFDKSPAGAEASVEKGAGCGDEGNASNGLVYIKQGSSDPSKENGSVIIKSEEPVDTTGLRYIIFYIKDTQGSNTLKLSLIDNDGKETPFNWVSPSTIKNQWKQYYVPLENISGDIDRTKITGIRIGQWNSGTYYIDNVYFDNYIFTGAPDSGISFPEVEEGEVKTSVNPGILKQTTAIELIADPEACIYYTTDGTEPKRLSKYLYNGVISISKDTTIKAMAVKDGTEGEIYTFEYGFVLPYLVTATNVAGSYTDKVVVEFRTENDKDLIYYTTDGTEPARGEGTTKQFIKPMLVTESTTFKAVAYSSQNGTATETSSEFVYTIIDSGKTAEPVFSKPEGTYGDTINVELIADGDIYYTTDGTEPTTASAKYESAIKVEADMTICAISVKNDVASGVAKAAYTISKEETPFLKTDGKVLKDNYGTGDVITLRGTNAGGWLVTEDWQCPVNAKDQLTSQTVFTKRFGKETAQELIDLYQDGWWTEEDFDLVKQEGMNVLRLPITYFEMLNEDGTLKDSAFDRLQWFVENCEKRGLYVLIDMHGAVGSQNGKDHSGDTSIPNVGNFYGNDENISKTIKLWEAVAEKYKDNPWVCGYDLLNEPSAVGTIQFEVYDRIYDAIRKIDKNHPIYIQSIWEPTHLPDPSYYGWQNVVYEYHFYGWNVETDAEGQRAFIQSKVDMVNKDTDYDVPLLVGEFTFFSNTDSWKAMDIFEQQGWSYTTWTFKVTGKGSSWGIYTAESQNRKVDINNDSEEVIRTKWSAENLNTTTGFTRNDKYADILKDYYANNKNNKAGTADATDIGLTEKLTLKPGETANLNAKVVPDNTTYKTLYFSTSDDSVAGVSTDGVVTAKKNGTAVITVTNLYGMKKTCTVTVSTSSGNAPSGGNNFNYIISIPPTNTPAPGDGNQTGNTPAPGDGNQAENTPAPGDGNQAENTPAPGDGNQAENTPAPGGDSQTGNTPAPGDASQGDNTPNQGGTDNEPNEQEVVKVKKITITGISKKIAAGQKITLDATVKPDNAADKSIKWTTSNSKYATVSGNGVVTTKKKGIGETVTITAKAKDDSGVKASYKIKIVKHSVKSIKLSTPNKTVKAGSKFTVKANVTTTGNTANKTLSWSVNNQKYATVTSDGKVTTTKAGKGKTITITAKATDGTGESAKIKVKLN